jgi:hypothetical protein
MTDEKKPTYAELLKNINKTTKVAPDLARQVQDAKFKNKVTSNRPTKRAAGRGG